MVATTLRQWTQDDYRVLRNEATKSAFVEFIPGLIDGLAHAEDPDDAVGLIAGSLGERLSDHAPLSPLIVVAVASLQAIAAPVDMVVLMVPAAAVPQR